MAVYLTGIQAALHTRLAGQSPFVASVINNGSGYSSGATSLTVDSLPADIDNGTSIRLQNEIKSLQEQVFNLRRELTFYKGIITASSYSRGLNIQGLHIETTRKQTFFKYKLVLTNIGNSDSITEVTIDMSVEGNDKSGFRALSSGDIIPGAELKRKIKVRNFERIEGNFNFPNGFEPLRVLVDLQQHDKEKLRLHRVFEWHVGEN